MYSYFFFFQSVQQADVKIVYYNSPVYFANAEIFVRQVQETSGVRPEKVLKKMKVMEKERSVSSAQTNNNKKEKKSINLRNFCSGFLTSVGYFRSSKNVEQANACPVSQFLTCWHQ